MGERMKAWRVVLAFAWFLQGCAGLDEIVYVDSNFTVTDEADIRAAADAWEVATDGSVRFDLVFGQRVEVGDPGRRVLVKATEREAQRWAADFDIPELARPTTVGLTVNRDRPTYRWQDIFFVPERAARWGMTTSQAIAHELGHAAGLHHVDDADAIMVIDSAGAPELVSRHCLPPPDYLQVRHVAGLGPNFRICR